MASQESEYELKRKQKIKENNEMMRTIFGEALNLSNTTNKHSCTAPITTARAKSCLPRVAETKTVLTPVRRNPRRSTRSYSTDDNDGCSVASDEDITFENTQNRLFVHWVGPLTKRRRIEGKCPRLYDNERLIF